MTMHEKTDIRCTVHLTTMFGNLNVHVPVITANSLLGTVRASILSCRISILLGALDLLIFTAHNCGYMFCF